ncbi:MAG: MerR family DNA-binding transcriptional regulator, partial [Pseudomonadales bacterium]|nr:MerR family DNA-binding transcriptional regulator [Pseudomonadales bacterium]
MKIGELAKRSGCSIQTIRYYEKEGLISAPARTDGNFRVYDTPALEKELWSFLVYGEIEGWRILLIDSGKNHNQQRMIRHDPVYPESAFTTRRT